MTQVYDAYIFVSLTLAYYRNLCVMFLLGFVYCILFNDNMTVVITVQSA